MPARLPARTPARSRATAGSPRTGSIGQGRSPDRADPVSGSQAREGRRHCYVAIVRPSDPVCEARATRNRPKAAGAYMIVHHGDVPIQCRAVSTSSYTGRAQFENPICTKRLTRLRPVDASPLGRFSRRLAGAMLTGRATWQFLARRVQASRPRRNARTSAANNAGSSKAAKRPPAGMSVRCTTSQARSTQRLGGIWFAPSRNLAMPVGTVTRPPAGRPHQAASRHPQPAALIDSNDQSKTAKS